MSKCIDFIVKRDEIPKDVLTEARLNDVNKILEAKNYLTEIAMTSEYPVDEPITNSGMAALSFTCMFQKPILNSELISENAERIEKFKEFFLTMEDGE